MNASSAACILPLFVPANRPDRFAKAANAGADAVIIDLEDAVPPQLKVESRSGITHENLPSAPTILRTNAAASPWFADDLAAAKSLGITCLLLPKFEDANVLAGIRAITGDIEIIALIETARGLANVRAIAASGVARLAFGSIDLSADLGCAHIRDNLLPARFEIVLASKLAGLPPPLDGITEAIDRPELVEADARHASDLGFGGKFCIHPKQIAPARAGFRPNAAEIDWATAVMGAPDDGAARVDGAMVDAPVRARARQILARR